MATIITNTLEAFIESLNYNLDVLAVTTGVDTTTINVSNSLYARPRLEIFVNGAPTTVVSATDCQIVVNGVFPVVNLLALPKPYFIHGTPYAANKELDREIAYPVIYLLEIVRETIPTDLDSRFATIPDLRIFFLDEADFRQWDTDELYSMSVIPQRRFAEFFLKAIYSYRYFGLPESVQITSFAKFGQYYDFKGSLNSLFNKQLSGLELSITLPVVKPSCSNC